MHQKRTLIGTLQAALICSIVPAALAQPPLIYNHKILNAASYMPPSLPGGAIAQGSIFSIFGARLGPPSSPSLSFPLQTTLGGVSITVTQGSTTVKAIPIYVSASQINAIMPSNAPLGMSSLRVLFNNVRSNPMTVNVGASALGIFSATETGLGPGILQNFISQSNQPINSPTTAAQPGQVITLWGTGLGPVAADNVAPTAGNLPVKVEVFVGGVAVTNVLYSGRTPCCAGVDQIVFQVPSNAPQGCWVPVGVRTAGATLSNFVTMAITPDGSPCSSGAKAPPFVSAGKYLGIFSLRTVTHEDLGTISPIDVTGDYTSAIAYQVPASSFPFNPVFSPPPAGTCTAYSVKGDLLRGDTLPGAVPFGAAPLNFGGALTLSGPGGVKSLMNILPEQPLSYLGGSITGNFFSNTLFLEPGSYQINAIGGSDIHGFSVSANMPSPVSWTNQNQLTAVNRSQPLTIAWTGGAGAQAAVVGFGVDLPSDTTTVFGCLAAAGASSLTVPPIVLSNLPPTRPNPLQSKSVIYLLSAPSSSIAPINAGGLDAGFAGFGYAAAKTVRFQ